MKKFAIGCLIVVVLLAVVGGGAAYWLYGKAKSYVGQFQALTDLDKKVTNVGAFTAPANDELTQDMVQRFVAVQESMQTTLGARVADMKSKQDTLLKSQEGDQRQPSAAEAIGVVTDLMKLIMEGKTAKVDALNQQRFSLAEYQWVRNHVYQAAGVEIVELSLPTSPGAPKAGGGITRVLGDSGAAVPARNRELVAPLVPKLKEWAPLAFFGL
ncbi:MAG: hypothetical protein WCP29_04900 [Acidobacteriota bacterium]